MNFCSFRRNRGIPESSRYIIWMPRHARQCSKSVQVVNKGFFGWLSSACLQRGARPVKNMHLDTIRIQADQIGIGYLPLLVNCDPVYTVKPTPEEEEGWIFWCEQTLRQVQRIDRKDKKIYYTSSSGARSLYLLDARNPTERRIIQL